MEKQIHFIGIGGGGMSALAQVCCDRGWCVSGSDRLFAQGGETPVLSTLRREGVELFPQDGSGVTAEKTVVYSTAIEVDNPDLVEARRVGARVLHRSEALAELARGYELIAVTGTCGKSSVTALLGYLLTMCGREPAVINGAEITGWNQGGTRIGSARDSSRADGLMVVEADESDKSLMVLSPTHVIVTNASSDHFPKIEAEELFRTFKAKASGYVVDLSDGSGTAQWISSEGWGSTFVWRESMWRLSMPGVHNIANAEAALSMAVALGCDPEVLRVALTRFRGIRRRLERVGMCQGAMVVDDYAHNIEKLQAAWSTLTAVFPRGVFGVWRPHGYAPLRKMLDGLAAMFNATVRPCDRLLVLPVYDAGGSADRSVNSEALLARLTCPAEGVASLPEAETRLRALAEPGACLAVLGARDPGLSVLAAALANSQ